MSVDLVVEMARQIPTMKAVKDEAGDPLARVTQIIERTGGKLALFSGNGVRTMIDEMRLGFSGHCPYTVLSDFYAAAFDLWHAGKHREAFDMFGRMQAFNSVHRRIVQLLVGPARHFQRIHQTTRRCRRGWRRRPGGTRQQRAAGRSHQESCPRRLGRVHEAVPRG